jgi:hypothetical protein
MFIVLHLSLPHLNNFLETLSCIISILCIHTDRESLIEWKKDPSFPNATLYSNNINGIIIYKIGSTFNATFFFIIIHIYFFILLAGSDSITQKISHSSTYYVAIGNMNPQNVKVMY